MHTLEFEAIGTAWSISTPEPLARADRAAMDSLIARYDLLYSRFRPDSLVAEMGRRAGTWELPASAAGLLRLFDSLNRVTGGAVNPLVGRSLEVLGYDAGYSLKPSGPPLPAAGWANTVSWQEAGGRTLLTTSEPVVFDVGAAGKGQLVDLVCALLVEAGHNRYVVDAGSDVRHRGSPLRVALEHPFDPTRAIGVLSLQDCSLCASAANRRSWGDGLHHVLDALTGMPVDSVAATWVRAGDTMTADGLATALFFTDPQQLAGEFAFDYVRMFSDGRADYSNAMAGVLFP